MDPSNADTFWVGPPHLRPRQILGFSYKIKEEEGRAVVIKASFSPDMDSLSAMTRGPFLTCWHFLHQKM